MNLTFLQSNSFNDGVFICMVIQSLEAIEFACMRIFRSVKFVFVQASSHSLKPHTFEKLYRIFSDNISTYYLAEFHAIISVKCRSYGKHVFHYPVISDRVIDPPIT